MFTYICHNSPNRHNEPTLCKPDVITDYNNFKLGVNKLDHLMSYYSFLDNSIKWWRKLFLDCWDDCCQCLYNSHKKHWLTLITQYDTPCFLKRIDYSIDTVQTSRPVLTAWSNIDRLSGQPHFLEKWQKRRDCVVYSDRSEKWWKAYV